MSPLDAPAWLTARPIAHRGLHDAARGIVENSIAAADAAVGKAYAIECDVQCTKDGEAIVFHDVMLDRLTLAKGDIGSFTAAEVTRIPFREGDGTVVTLPEFLAKVDGRVPVIVEIKSRFDGDTRLAARVASLAYSGPLAIQSFDPQVLAFCRTLDLTCPLGLVAQAAYDDFEWLETGQRNRLAMRVDFSSITPDFLAWRAADLPHAFPLICRAGRMPVLAWTLSNAPSSALARPWVDQIIFEGFEPEQNKR